MLCDALREAECNFLQKIVLHMKNITISLLTQDFIIGTK